MIAACGADGLSSACAPTMRLKYSKARRSSCATPLPSAYIRPSFHCAIGWPPSAAYCSAVSEVSGVVTGATFFSADPGCPETTGMVAFWFTGAPSKANAEATGTVPSSNAKMIRSDVRIALLLVRTTRMGYGPSHCRPNLLGIFPEHPRRVIRLARRPHGFAFRKLHVGQFYVKCSNDSIDLDDVPVLQEPDGAAQGSLRADMADAEAAGRAGETTVGDEGDLAAHALPGQRRRGRKHLTHPRTAARPLVADHEDFAFLVGPLLNGFQGILFPVEAAGRPSKFQIRHTRDLHDRALGREIAFQADHATGNGDRLIGRPHHILARIPFHAFEVFGDRPAGDRQTVTVQKSVIEQRFHQKRYATSFEHVFGDITTSWLQIRDIRCLFEDFRHVK